MVDGPPVSALVEFWARNVRSYRDEVVLSMEATRLANKDVVRTIQTAAAVPERILPVAGVFGANASGKSAILKALWDMTVLVQNSFRRGGRGTGMRRVPFLLDADSREQPSAYGVELVLDGVRWRYGFELDDQRVTSEFAVYYPKGRGALAFEREGGALSFGRAFRGVERAIRPLLRENALLLSTLGAADLNPASSLFGWFEGRLVLADSETRGIGAGFTARAAKSDAYRSRILNLLRAADLGVVDAEVVRADAAVVERVKEAYRVMHGLPTDDAPGEEWSGEAALIDQQVEQVVLAHLGRDGAVRLSPEDESTGTQVWVSLLMPILATLKLGQVLLIDELDGSLHPLLVERIVEMFQSPKTNPRCAQLIFNAHDINLLGHHCRSRLSLAATKSGWPRRLKMAAHGSGRLRNTRRGETSQLHAGISVGAMEGYLDLTTPVLPMRSVRPQATRDPGGAASSLGHRVAASRRRSG